MTAARRHRARGAIALGALAIVAPLVVAACTPYRIEHRRRAGFESKMVEGGLPDRVVLDDGTVIEYTTGPRGASMAPPADEGDGAERRVFKLRDERPDGSIQLHALVPQNVVANTLVCLRNEEYELLWREMLAQEARDAYERDGQGVEEFADYCRRNRIELAQFLNRMNLGFASYQTVIDRREDGVLVCRLWPKVAELFRFRRVLMVYEDYEVRLLGIE